MNKLKTDEIRFLTLYRTLLSRRVTSMHNFAEKLVTDPSKTIQEIASINVKLYKARSDLSNV